MGAAGLELTVRAEGLDLTVGAGVSGTYCLDAAGLELIVRQERLAWGIRG